MSKRKTEKPKAQAKTSQGTSKPLVYGPVHKPSGEKKINPKGNKN